MVGKRGYLLANDGLVVGHVLFENAGAGRAHHAVTVVVVVQLRVMTAERTGIGRPVAAAAHAESIRGRDADDVVRGQLTRRDEW
jgi:hypothetical protein